MSEGLLCLLVIGGIFCGIMGAIMWATRNEGKPLEFECIECNVGEATYGPLRSFCGKACMDAWDARLDRQRRATVRRNAGEARGVVWD